MISLVKYLSSLLEDKFKSLGYDTKFGKVTISNRPDLCQFQCNGSLPAAKIYKKAPLVIANEVLELLKEEKIFKNITVANPGFINMDVTDEFLMGIINEINDSKNLGVPKNTSPKTIMVDYGGANVAKPLHVGHLRSAIIGESIKRISKFLGHNVIGDVHLGDWGLQMGMVITELQRRQPDLPYFDENFKGQYPTLAPFTIDELEDIYPSANALCKSNEAAMEAAQKATVELQNGRPGYFAIWEHILNVSVADLKKNYGNLNVEFDLWKGESDSQPVIPELITYLNDNNYTYRSEGALVIDVEKEDDKAPIPPIIIQKSDGGALYGTTDMATIKQRMDEFNPDEIIYVVDKRQALHFEQVFRAVRKTNIAPSNLALQFIGFGTMNGKDGKPFKTRDGGVMRLQDLIALIKDNVRNKLKENDEMSQEEQEEIARKVGLAALKYGDLSNMATKDYVFDLDKFASFEGNTGPYILYTVVRIKSILRKASESFNIETSKISNPNSDTERALLLQLTKFNDTIEGVYEDKAPHKLCEYIYELCNLINKFYHENKILSEENKDLKISWLNLLSLSQRTIECVLELLGLEAPERM